MVLHLAQLLFCERRMLLSSFLRGSVCMCHEGTQKRAGVSALTAAGSGNGACKPAGHPWQPHDCHVQRRTFRDAHCGISVYWMLRRLRPGRQARQAAAPAMQRRQASAGARVAAGATFVDVGGVARHNNGVVALPARPARGERVAIMSAQVRGGRAVGAVGALTIHVRHVLLCQRLGSVSAQLLPGTFVSISCILRPSGTA